MDTERLGKLAAELTARRDAMVGEANRQIAFLEGQIALINELIAPSSDDEPGESPCAPMAGGPKEYHESVTT